MTYRVGDKIHINSLNTLEPGRDYNGREGEITSIDEEGWMYGTWGYLPILPDYDDFELIKE